MGNNYRDRHESVKKSFYLKPDIYEKMKENLGKANASTETEFVNKALDFYIGFLKTENTETYLLNTFSSVIHSTVDMSEERIMNMLYKLAVEVAMQNRIVAYKNNLSEEEILKIENIAVHEIGAI